MEKILIALLVTIPVLATANADCTYKVSSTRRYLKEDIEHKIYETLEKKGYQYDPNSNNTLSADVVESRSGIFNFSLSCWSAIDVRKITASFISNDKTLISKNYEDKYVRECVHVVQGIHPSQLFKAKKRKSFSTLLIKDLENIPSCEQY